jgi:hypothetical protein
MVGAAMPADQVGSPNLKLKALRITKDEFSWLAEAGRLAR